LAQKKNIYTKEGFFVMNKRMVFSVIALIVLTFCGSVYSGFKGKITTVSISKNGNGSNRIYFSDDTGRKYVAILNTSDNVKITDQFKTTEDLDRLMSILMTAISNGLSCEMGSGWKVDEMGNNIVDWVTVKQIGY
jgi:hypothetical protein